MNKVFSVLKLYFRETVRALLIILLLMSAAELVMYFINSSQAYDFSWLIDSCHIYHIFIVAYVSMLVMNSTVNLRNSNYGYTMQRLQISERSAFLIQCAAYTVNLLIVHLWQMILVYVLYRLCMAKGYQTAATVYSEFYKNNTLGLIIPLLRKGQWMINAIVLILGGLETASINVKTRYGKYINIGFVALLPRFYSIIDTPIYRMSGRIVLVMIDFFWACELTHNGKGRR